jgi:hypothetical protein
MPKPFSHPAFVKVRGEDADRNPTEAEIAAWRRRWELKEARAKAKPIAEAAVRRAIERARKSRS